MQCRRLFEVPVKGAFADAENFRDVTDCAALVAHSGCFAFFGCRECGWSASDFAAFSCGGEACVCAFAQKLAFEAGEGSEDMEEQFSAGGGRVQLLGDRCEGHSPGFEIRDEFDQVREVASESVEPPHGEGVAGQ